MIRVGSNQRGAVLVIAMIFLTVLTLIGVVVLDRSDMDTSMATNFQERNRAFQAAETRIAEAVAQFVGGTAGQFNTETPQDPLSGDVADKGASATLTTAYIAKSAPDATDEGWGISCCEFHHFNLKSVGKSNKGSAVEVNRGIRIVGAKDDVDTVN